MLSGLASRAQRALMRAQDSAELSADSAQLSSQRSVPGSSDASDCTSRNLPCFSSAKGTNADEQPSGRVDPLPAAAREPEFHQRVSPRVAVSSAAVAKQLWDSLSPVEEGVVQGATAPLLDGRHELDYESESARKGMVCFCFPFA